MIYAIRIARPLDTRLKKRHVGPLSVTTGAVMLYLAWGWLRPDGLSAVYFIGEFAGGLDRRYRQHKLYAISCSPPTCSSTSSPVSTGASTATPTGPRR
ncbi:hypothetical protein ACFRK5_29945 [Streptomyces niveus]|uniref:hypothetical protein n=1 Tax=Streptomyces niveus TaxID=193462 RepID=UPI0036759CB2